MKGWGLSGVSVRYGHHLALDGVTLRTAPGRIAAVVGGDGAGKTTLLRCAAGALPPSSGQVRTPGIREIGYLSPSGGIYPDLTVEENLSFRAAVFGLRAAQARERVAEHLDRTGLAAAHARLAGNLSGGMRKKLGVIAAMLPGPALLVLDEPTTGVDPVSRADLWWLIAQAAAGGAAVLFSTTYLDEAQRAAHVVVLDAGRPLASGTSAEIVAAMPGVIRPLAARPAGSRRLAWRRAGQWRAWDPLGVPGTARVLPPDLQDAVVVAALAREQAQAPGAGGRRTGGAGP
jgi:ABC-2 type transport system ATP-binding protein